MNNARLRLRSARCPVYQHGGAGAQLGSHGPRHSPGTKHSPAPPGHRLAAAPRVSRPCLHGSLSIPGQPEGFPRWEFPWQPGGMEPGDAGAGAGQRAGRGRAARSRGGCEMPDPTRVPGAAPGRAQPGRLRAVPLGPVKTPQAAPLNYNLFIMEDFSQANEAGSTRVPTLVFGDGRQGRGCSLRRRDWAPAALGWSRTGPYRAVPSPAPLGPAPAPPGRRWAGAGRSGAHGAAHHSTARHGSARLSRHGIQVPQVRQDRVLR